MEAVAAPWGFRGNTKGEWPCGHWSWPDSTQASAVSCGGPWRGQPSRICSNPAPVLGPGSSGPAAPGHCTPSSHHTRASLASPAKRGFWYLLVLLKKGASAPLLLWPRNSRIILSNSHPIRYFPSRTL